VSPVLGQALKSRANAQSPDPLGTSHDSRLITEVNIDGKIKRWLVYEDYGPLSPWGVTASPEMKENY
jgi:hypothetical protein